MSLDNLVKKVEDKPCTDLCLADSSPIHVKMIEFSPKRKFKINPSLSAHHEEELSDMLRKHMDDFAWNYKEMKVVHPFVCTHHIYIKEECKTVRQPQMRMNSALKDIVKEGL